MRLSSALTSTFFALSCVYADAAAKEVFRPLKIGFDELVDPMTNFPSRKFESALTQVGLVSVTGLPGNVKKDDALSWLHACALESGATKEHRFPDDTVRRTMATHTIPGPGGAQIIDHMTSSSAACDSFSSMTSQFREVTGVAIKAFAERLSDILGSSGGDDEPLLSVEGNAYHFNTFADVVENGEHLEHFHSYQKEKTGSLKARNTIDMHTDQGLFIAFTPGAIVREDESRIDRLSDGFYIELADGSQAMVEFDAGDDLVFMLGDGVTQLVNSRYNKSLRATPHALSMPQHSEGEARVWYGRMVLPPSSAVHPEHGETFGKIREGMINASLSGNEEMGVGCSKNMIARQLETQTCAEGTTLCWHRCMDNAEYNVSPEICSSLGLDLRCMNPRGQLWDEKHGDFFPACADLETAEIATPYPTLPNYPRSDGGECDHEHFEEFAKQGNYDHTIHLTDVGILSWTVRESAIDARLAYDGLFGYLAIGFTGPTPARKNGMNGANILMGLPGGEYSPVTGLDMSLPSNVHTYIIDPVQSSFRHWMQPVDVEPATATGRSVPATSVEATDCFTALMFVADNINGIPFNLDGTDDLIWGANGVDIFAGYHGRDARSRFNVTWATGEGGMDDGHDHDHEHDHGDHHHPDSTDPTSADVETGETSGTSKLAVACSLIVSVAATAATIVLEL